MNFTYVGGTAQQQKWVQDAIDQCSYPLDNQAIRNANVTVVWAASLPANDTGKLHAYMVTNNLGGGEFKITIASWADDPNNLSNQGLPNPAQDIYDFYKSSFVHELGHVVALSTIDVDEPSDVLSEACGLFWTNKTKDGSPRRYGTADDWDTVSLAWVEEIREAVAEVFRCTFYKGRQIYQNRTQWNIDPGSFQKLLTLMPKPQRSGIYPITYDSLNASSDPSNYVQPGEVNGSTLINADGPPIVSGGSFTVKKSQSSPPTTIEPTLIYAKDWPLFFLSGFDWSSTIRIDELPLNTDGAYSPPPNLGFVDASGDPHFPFPSIYETDSLQTTALTTPGSAPPAPDGFPYWVKLFVHLLTNQFFISNYNSDPNAPGGAAAIQTAVWTPSRPATPGAPRPCLLMYGEDVFGDVGKTVIGEWRVDTYYQTDNIDGVGADFPFGQGDLEVSDGQLRGAIVFGH